jgi:branched-chain amino acid transport system permease protein
VIGAKSATDWHLDVSVTLLIAAVAGAVTAVIVGLPALRLSGLYVAVITFAFALATTSYLLNRRFFDWIPVDRVERRPVLGRIDIDSPTRIYYLALIGLAIVLIAVRGIRRSRTGRVLIAMRENERTAQSVGVSVLRAKLTAFAVSGAIAGFAGCIFVLHQQSFGETSYDPFENLIVFTQVVIGGIASVPGALLGALYLRSLQWFLSPEWQLLAQAGSILFVLLVVPMGLGGLLFRLRDRWLRWVAVRRHLVVPSMLADVAVPEPPPPAEPEPAAVGAD